MRYLIILAIVFGCNGSGDTEHVQNVSGVYEVLDGSASIVDSLGNDGVIELAGFFLGISQGSYAVDVAGCLGVMTCDGDACSLDCDSVSFESGYPAWTSGRVEFSNDVLTGVFVQTFAAGDYQQTIEFDFSAKLIEDQPG